MPRPKTTKRSLLKRLTNKPVIAVLALILLIGAGLAYNQFRDGQDAYDSASSDPQSGNYVNLDPPTEQEKKDADANKKTLVEEPGTPAPPPSDGKKQVTPEIASADRSEVRAHVPGIFEDGGTCTATATKAGESPITASSKGFGNYSDTKCEPISLSLPSGGWSVVVSYSSSTAKGSSEAYVVE